MSAQVHDNKERMNFQSKFIPDTIVKKGGAEYAIFQSELDNDNVSMRLEMKVLNSVIKNDSFDIIKNDHVILQKTPSDEIFFLFEAKKDLFVEQDDQSKVFHEEVKTSQYSYDITFTQKAKKAEAANKDAAPIRTGDISADVNAILQKYGLKMDNEEEAVVDSFMQSWKLGHPDEE